MKKHHKNKNDPKPSDRIGHNVRGPLNGSESGICSLVHFVFIVFFTHGVDTSTKY